MAIEFEAKTFKSVTCLGRWTPTHSKAKQTLSITGRTRSVGHQTVIGFDEAFLKHRGTQ